MNCYTGVLVLLVLRQIMVHLATTTTTKTHALNCQQLHVRMQLALFAFLLAPSSSLRARASCLTVLVWVCVGVCVLNKSNNKAIFFSPNLKGIIFNTYRSNYLCITSRKRKHIITGVWLADRHCTCPLNVHMQIYYRVINIVNRVYKNPT